MLLAGAVLLAVLLAGESSRAMLASARHSCYCLANRSANLVVGVTSTSPEDREPVIGGYAECGRYSEPVSAGATVNLQCSRPLFGKYVIMQFPTTGVMNVCEIEVCTEGKLLNGVSSSRYWISHYTLNVSPH